MTPAAIIYQAAADGVSLELSPGGTIKAVGDHTAVSRWLPVLRENKRAILEALAHPDPLPPVPRGLGGYTTPPGVPPLGDCALARQLAVPIAGLPKPQAPVNLDEALAAACDGVGITPEVFRSLLSPEDLQDIAAGDIPVETLHGYAMSFAEGLRSGRIVVRKDAKPCPASGIVITAAEIDAARKGQLVVKQVDFTGAPEVKP